MSKITFRGATIDKYESYCSNAGQTTVEIHFKASWSEPVCETMGWTKEPKGFGNGSLDGKLAGISMMVEPNGAQLRDYRFDIRIDSIGKFKHVAKEKDGEVVDRSLTFIATTTDESAPLCLDKWLRAVGPSDSTAQVAATYNAEEQMDLAEDGEPSEEDSDTETAPVESATLTKTRGRRREHPATEAVQ